MPHSSPIALRALAVDYSDSDTVFEGYAVAPCHASTPLPCIVLAHDWSGLTTPTVRLAERYAGLGYVCVAIDAYGKGVRGDPSGDNTALMEPLMRDRALLRRRLLAGFEAARALAGVDPARVRQLDWWDETTVGGIRLAAVPARHFSGRTLLDEDRTLWASWVIMTGDLRLFFSGDTGYHADFKTIGDRYGPFDVTMLETGAYDRQWAEVHMQPEQTLQALSLIHI